MTHKNIPRIILLILVVGFAGILIFNKISKDKKAQQEKQSMSTVSRDLELDAFIVKPVNLKNDLESSGSLLSNEAVSIQPEISARLTHIYFKEGSFVSKGTPLVKLFDADLKAQLEKLHLQKQLATLTLKRENQLLQVNGISQQQVDDTRNQVETIQADIDFSNAQLQKTLIRAPFSGILGLRNVSEGALVTPATIIVSLQQTNPLKMDFSIPEKYRNLIREGDPVTFTTAEDPHKIWSARIDAIQPEIDPTTRTVTIRAGVPNPQGLLHPGSFTNVHLQLKDTPKALMIPSEAVIPGTRYKSVILIQNRHLNFVHVETGSRNADQVEITNGLQAGDTIAITGMMQARPGVKVKLLSIH
ncbi:MAG: efflux RND transporter periplasmic adaptor subunit [Chitinophagaceae bacterium]